MSVPYRIRAALMSLQDALIFKYPGRINSSSGGQGRARDPASSFSRSLCSQQISSRLIYIAPELSCCALSRSSCERVCVAKKAASNPRRTDGIKWVAIPIIEPPRKRSPPPTDGEVRRRARALLRSFKGKLGNGKFR